MTGQLSECLQHNFGAVQFVPFINRARIGDLLTRMEASPLHIEKLEPDSPVFSFLL